MEKVVLSVRVDKSVVERIKAVTSDVPSFLREAIVQKLNPVEVSPLTDKEKRTVLKESKTIMSLIQDAVLQRLSNGGDFLSTVTDEEFAKLVMRLLPKEQQEDGELSASLLSLATCLKMLPAVEDISKELRKVKGDLVKAEFERDTALKLLKHGKGGIGMDELSRGIFNGMVNYVFDMVSRGNLPGFGDGGGLTDKEYASCAGYVKRELEKLKIHGV